MYMYHSNALSRQPEAKIKFIKQNKAKFTEKQLAFLVLRCWKTNPSEIQ